MARLFERVRYQHQSTRGKDEVVATAVHDMMLPVSRSSAPSLMKPPTHAGGSEDHDVSMPEDSRVDTSSIQDGKTLANQREVRRNLWDTVVLLSTKENDP